MREQPIWPRTSIAHRPPERVFVDPGPIYDVPSDDEGLARLLLKTPQLERFDDFL